MAKIVMVEVGAQRGRPYRVFCIKDARGQVIGVETDYLPSGLLRQAGDPFVVSIRGGRHVVADSPEAALEILQKMEDSRS